VTYEFSYVYQLVNDGSFLMLKKYLKYLVEIKCDVFLLLLVAYVFLQDVA